MSNRLKLLEAIAAAACDCILANGLQVVGRDGRSRALVTKLESEGTLATLLREAGLLPSDEAELVNAQAKLIERFRKRPAFSQLDDKTARALFGEAHPTLALHSRSVEPAKAEGKV